MTAPLKPQPFELVPAGEYPQRGSAKRAPLRMALLALNAFPTRDRGDGVRLKITGPPSHSRSLQNAATQIARRMGFEVSTTIREGWLYIKRKTSKVQLVENPRRDMEAKNRGIA